MKPKAIPSDILNVNIIMIIVMKLLAKITGSSKFISFNGFIMSIPTKTNAKEVAGEYATPSTNTASTNPNSG